MNIAYRKYAFQSYSDMESWWIIIVVIIIVLIIGGLLLYFYIHRPPPNPTVCTTQSHCPSGTICQNGRCLGGLGHSCSTTNPCATGYECGPNGTCIQSTSLIPLVCPPNTVIDGDRCLGLNGQPCFPGSCAPGYTCIIQPNTVREIGYCSPVSLTI